ncbi:MAG: non-ribosomal peptide synthetase [Capsulimonadales bacterium]|nr:non-ribosomal peptide synthetase [Capsulimonadales bacterium]
MVTSNRSAMREESLTADLTGTNGDRNEPRIWQRFEAQVRLTPDRAAVVGPRVTLTYRELNARANRLARQLRRQGVGPGVLVGLHCEPSPALMVGLLAILKAGGAYVPLDASYPRERLAFMLEDAEIRFLLAQESLLAHLALPGHGRTVALTLEAAMEETAPEDEIDLEPIATDDDPIYVIFTSGSTGRPKGAVVYHRGFSNLMRWYVDEFEITAADRSLLISSFSFDLTQKNLYAALIVGGELHLPAFTRYDAVAIREQIRHAGISLLNCTPSAFYPLVQEVSAEELRAVSSLRCVFLGGEPISVPRLRDWMESETYRAVIVNTYGPTECTDIAAFHRIESVAPYLENPVPIGKAIPGAELFVLDEARQPVPEGVNGELWVAGVGVGGGYLKRPELNAERFLPCPFTTEPNARMYRTGDLVQRRSDGNYYFIDRVDHQVKIRGFRIEMGEIEAVLQQHFDIRDAAIVAKGKPDEERSLAAYFVRRDGAPEPTALIGVLKDFLRQRLPDHMIPAHWIALPNLPLTPNGKVDRRALSELPLPVAQSAPPNTPSGMNLASETERVIVEAWRDILRIPDPDRNANFFDIGGNSINIVQVHARLRQRLDPTLPITVMFECTSIRALARRLERKAVPPSPATGSAPASAAERARLQRAALARQQRPGSR